MVLNIDKQLVADEPVTNVLATDDPPIPSPRQGTKPATKPKERVQFDFSHDLLQILDDIMEKTGAATRAEAMRKAIKVYNWLADAEPDNIIKVVGANNEVIQAVKAKLLL